MSFFVLYPLSKQYLHAILQEYVGQIEKTVISFSFNNNISFCLLVCSNKLKFSLYLSSKTVYISPPSSFIYSFGIISIKSLAEQITNVNPLKLPTNLFMYNGYVFIHFDDFLTSIQLNLPLKIVQILPMFHILPM